MPPPSMTPLEIVPPIEAVDRPAQFSLRQLMIATAIAAAALAMLPVIFGVMITAGVVFYCLYPLIGVAADFFRPRLDYCDEGGRRVIRFTWPDLVADTIGWILGLAFVLLPVAVVGVSLAVAGLWLAIHAIGLPATLLVVGLPVAIGTGWMAMVVFRNWRFQWRMNSPVVLDRNDGTLRIGTQRPIRFNEIAGVTIFYSSLAGPRHFWLWLQQADGVMFQIVSYSRQPFTQVTDAIAAARMFAEYLHLPVHWQPWPPTVE